MLLAVINGSYIVFVVVKIKLELHFMMEGRHTRNYKEYLIIFTFNAFV